MHEEISGLDGSETGLGGNEKMNLKGEMDTPKVLYVPGSKLPLFSVH